MKKIGFTQRHDNMFHTLKETTLRTSGQTVYGEAVITGHSMEDINEGDCLVIVGTEYTVKGAAKRRDHKGTFSDPSMNINLFFEVKTSFEKLIKQI